MKKAKIKKCPHCGNIFLMCYEPKAKELLKLGTIRLCAGCNYPRDIDNLKKLERYSKILGNEIYTNITLKELKGQIKKNN